MNILILSFLVSSLSTYLIIFSKKFHGLITYDHNTSGPQKFHIKPVPRIGGLAIYISLLSSIIIFKPSDFHQDVWMQTVIATSFPIFLIGFLEDILKKISVKTRLITITLASMCSCFLLNINIYETEIEWIDLLLNFPLISIMFTIFCITGLTNAYNIIDGFNGLAAMLGIITLVTISYVAYSVGDINIALLSVVISSAIFGVFLWNYPNAKIFLGDGGAYLIGYLISILSISIVVRNPTVSPWFAVLVNGYPVTETIVSIIRRSFFQKVSPGIADGLHFHSLIFRRRLISHRDMKRANSNTAELVWCVSMISICPSIIFWDKTEILQFCLLAFSFIYLSIYLWLIDLKK